jgi:anti-anti-sigma factor
LATDLDLKGRRPGHELRDLVMKSGNHCPGQLESPRSTVGDSIETALGLKRARLSRGPYGRVPFNDVAHLIKLEERAPASHDHRHGAASLTGATDMFTYDDFEIDVQRPAAEVVVLKLSGEVDLCTSFSLMESVAAVVAERPELIAVDLSGVEFMDGAGVRVLESAARQIDARRTRLAVICPSDNGVWRLLQLVGLHREAFVHESADEALRPWIGDKDDSSAGEKPLVQ